MQTRVSAGSSGWIVRAVSGALLLVLAGGTQALATAEPPLPDCSGCDDYGEPCALRYGGEGVVLDSETGDPIAGATIVVLDLEAVSAADGSFRVEGSRPDDCYIDYFFSMTVSAPGYEDYAFSYYSSHPYSYMAIELAPIGTTQKYTVSGFVAEFPQCMGRMRGVTVVLDPLGLTTQTSIDPVDGGRFSFADVPPGDFAVRVANGCNPHGCWELKAVHVEDADVSVSVCMKAPTPPPSLPPTPCPVTTPCVLGDHPLPCTTNPCGLGCGCEPCPPCGEGEVLEPIFNHCVCVPGHVDPSPTPTPTPEGSPAATPPTCTGDCDANGVIEISELIAAVSEALGAGRRDDCDSFDRDRSGAVGIDELISLVAAALNGCI